VRASGIGHRAKRTLRSRKMISAEKLDSSIARRRRHVALIDADQSRAERAIVEILLERSMTLGID